ncbi:MAG: GNAT family N-acetyltransferase, partial [Anaerolineae bacterium]|nr:GNAT family N-acetyltransferase [Anaerolineae bacterium]
RFLFADLLLWALEAWGDREPGLAIEIKARQTLEAGVLERHGFQQTGSFYTSEFDLTSDLVPRTPLEAGFTIVDMHSRPDFRAQRVLRHNAFAGESDLSEEELTRILTLYGYARESPIYHPQTDLCIMGPDGRFVAGCEALIDAANVAADIERVCTHSDYRRRGFARAVILECLYRLRDIGMQRAYITGYSPGAIALYRSLGHVAQTESLIFKR